VRGKKSPLISLTPGKKPSEPGSEKMRDLASPRLRTARRGLAAKLRSEGFTLHVLTECFRHPQEMASLLASFISHRSGFFLQGFLSFLLLEICDWRERERESGKSERATRRKN